MRISDWSSDVCSSDLRAPRGAARLDLARDMDRAARDEQFLGQRRLARVGVRDDGKGAAVGVRGHGSGPANCVFEASKWQRHWVRAGAAGSIRSEEHTSELQSLMRIPYAVFCLKKKQHSTHR